MSIPNKDEMKGKLREAKGAVKEKVGRATTIRMIDEAGRQGRARLRSSERRAERSAT